MQKVIVRVVGLGEASHFPNFLKYGFASLKMNGRTHTHTHTHTLHTTNPKTHFSSLFSSVAGPLCALCLRGLPAYTLISAVIAIISFPVAVMKSG